MNAGFSTSPNALARLEPGTLWAKAIAQTQCALDCGALQPIPTQSLQIEQSGIPFLVRILANIARKEKAKKQEENSSNPDFNPFLPYDRDLFVADLSPTHVCLLNKYNVVDHHLLIITRAFAEQTSLLTHADFAALWHCLAEVEGLGFYNSGKTAGASQRHKHLQLVPIPLVPMGQPIPIEIALADTHWDAEIGHSLLLPFQHAWMKLNWHETLSDHGAATLTQTAYHRLLEKLNLYDPIDQSLKGAYNLLITRQWLLIVPRRQEQFCSIPVNSLGFAGTLFVRDQQQLDRLQEITPLTLLQNVAQPL
ncbi:MAG: phosphorylase [Elainella sp. Prado103]|jgi:ATP adenylyltransferase|nr:phosphorylase [Elainella sp. Prado103]